MKMLTLLLFMSIYATSSYSQSTKMYGFWIAEKYIQAKAINDTNARSYLIPVQGFYFTKESSDIETYASDFRPISLKKITNKGNTKYEILNFSSNINIGAKQGGWDSVKHFATRMDNAKQYISIEGNKLILEIVDSNRTESIYFINTVNGATINTLHKYWDIYDIKH